MKAIFTYIVIIFNSYVSAGLNHSFNSADTSKGDLYFNTAERFYSDNIFDSSSFYYNKAAESYFSESRFDNYLKSLNYSALDFINLAKYEMGMNLLNDGLVFAIEKFGVYDSLTAVLFNSLGVAYYNQGNYDNALKSYDLSLQIKLSIFGSNHNETAFGYHNIGLVWNYMGDYEKALEYFNRALATWLPLKGKATSSIGNCYINIANVYSALEEYEKSIEFDLKALETWKSVLGDNHRYIAMSYNNLAESYSTISNYEKALEFANKSLQINLKIFGFNHPQIAKNKTLIGRIYKSKDNLELSERFITEALEIWSDFPNEGNKNETLFQLADLNIRLANYDIALTNYDSIIASTLPEILNSDFSPEASFNLPIINISYLYAVAGKGDVFFSRYKKKDQNIEDLTNANYWFDLYSRILKQIGKTFRRENSKLGLSKSIHSNNYKLLETYYELYRLIKNENYKNLAYSINADSKALILSDAIVESGAKRFGGIPDSLLEYEKDLQKELESNYNKLAYAEEEKMTVDQISEIRKKIFQINKNYDLLVKTYENNFPVYHALKYENSSSNNHLANYDLIDSSSALIEYFTADSIIYIFVLADKKITVERISTNSLIEFVKSFKNSLINLEFEEYLSSAYQLYEILINPIDRILTNKKRIHIITDGILNYLPFEALISEKINAENIIHFDEPEYLIKKFEISYHYSSNLLTKGKQKELAPSYSFAGFAPVFSDTEPKKINNLIDTSLISNRKTRSVEFRNKIYSELPYTEKEVLQIAQLFNEDNFTSKTYIKSQATEEILKSKEIQDYNIIHIASHGFINEKRPRLSGILFWENNAHNDDDSILHLGEIFNLDLKSDLVVLSACESGLGKLVRGEGIIGLSRGFIYAGTKNIIISLWQVADKSTAELMINFYKYFLDGYDFSQSLRLAKLKLINEKKYAYPLEWSPFILIGN